MNHLISQWFDVSKTKTLINVEQVKKHTQSYSGGVADSCWAYAVGEVSQEVKDLMDVTKECLYIGIEKAVVGNRIGDIGAAIQEYAESRGYGVVRDLVGHGVGPTMHEEPMVPHYGKAGRGLRLREGMVLTVEPMINTGTWEIDTDMKTGWAHKTLDGGYHVNTNTNCYHKRRSCYSNKPRRRKNLLR